MDDETKDALLKITDALENLTQKLGMISRIQLAIVDKVGEDDPKFQAKFMAVVLADDEFRADFTEHVNADGDDNTKAMMMDLNQMAYDIAKDIDNE
jgi:hypothetical protein